MRKQVMIYAAQNAPSVNTQSIDNQSNMRPATHSCHLPKYFSTARHCEIFLYEGNTATKIRKNYNEPKSVRNGLPVRCLCFRFVACHFLRKGSQKKYVGTQ